MNREQLLQRMAKAKSSGIGINIRDGKYRFAVKKIEMLDGFKGTRFVALFTVMSAQRVNVVSPQNGQVLHIEPNPVGSDVDWLQMLDDPDSPGPSNVRRLFEALFGRTMSDEEYLETLAEITDQDEEGKPLPEPLNLAKGMVIDGETIRTVTKKNKVEIVVVRWNHVPQNKEEQAAVAQWIDTVAGGTSGNGSMSETRA